MLLELMTAAVGVEESLANASAVSGRRREMVLYTAGVVQATVSFFEALDPDDEGRAVCDAFLHWQRSILRRLEQEVVNGHPGEDDGYVETTERFLARFRAAIVETAPGAAEMVGGATQ